MSAVSLEVLVGNFVASVTRDVLYELPLCKTKHDEAALFHTSTKVDRRGSSTSPARDVFLTNGLRRVLGKWASRKAAGDLCGVNFCAQNELGFRAQNGRAGRAPNEVGFRAQNERAFRAQNGLAFRALIHFFTEGSPGGLILGTKCELILGTESELILGTGIGTKISRSALSEHPPRAVRRTQHPGFGSSLRPPLPPVCLWRLCGMPGALCVGSGGSGCNTSPVPQATKLPAKPARPSHSGVHRDGWVPFVGPLSARQ